MSAKTQKKEDVTPEEKERIETVKKAAEGAYVHIGEATLITNPAEFLETIQERVAELFDFFELTGMPDLTELELFARDYAFFNRCIKLFKNLLKHREDIAESLFEKYDTDVVCLHGCRVTYNVEPKTKLKCEDSVKKEKTTDLFGDDENDDE